LGRDGTVAGFGQAMSYGLPPGQAMTSQVEGDVFVGIVPTRDGLGYWLVRANGAISSFGDARSKKSFPMLKVPPGSVVGAVAA
jgi:hypothetical protein